MPIKVLVIDDSPVMRALLTEVIAAAPDMKVVGSAPDPLTAREMIKALNPDVLTLDVEMPKMDGLEFLSRLMRLRPMPVIMVSSLTEKGSEVTLQALELGAVDFVSKPSAGSPTALHAYSEELLEKIRAAHAVPDRLQVQPSAAAGGIQSSGASTSSQSVSARALTEKVIAIGASTGGTEAIKAVLTALPANMPPIVMVQHMPETFTPSFAQRLDSLSKLRVIEAQGGEVLQPGHAYLAPGHSHLLLRRRGNGYVTELSKAEPVNRHRPAVDALFNSVAETVGANAIGVILTGMGRDGAAGMAAMRRAGAWNIGQDKDSCVVYGMPRAAAEAGALDEVAPLADIPVRLLTRLR
ncbi:MAG TPA: chemotaxis response regulator protein-glutamate methylesterase [Rhodocyclaceae bacterium]|nr:chemotaxis response regulator protein-glutamate methylesterase [Rhodocyclaceae bacterium]